MIGSLDTLNFTITDLGRLQVALGLTLGTLQVALGLTLGTLQVALGLTLGTLPRGKMVTVIVSRMPLHLT